MEATIIISIIALSVVYAYIADRRSKNNKQKSVKRKDEVVYKVQLLNPVTMPYDEIEKFTNQITSLPTLERYKEISVEMHAPQEVIDLIERRIEELNQNYSHITLKNSHYDDSDDDDLNTNHRRNRQQEDDDDDLAALITFGWLTKD